MENKKEFLTEENYNNANKKVKKIGNILIILGLVLLVGGFILIVSGFLGFGNQVNNGIQMGQDGINPGGIFSSFGGFALGGFMIVPGLFITVVGLMVRFLIGNRREITAYTTQQVMPIAREGIEKMAPTIGKAGASIAKEVVPVYKDIVKEMSPVYGDIAKEISKGIKEGINEADKNK